MSESNIEGDGATELTLDGEKRSRRRRRGGEAAPKSHFWRNSCLGMRLLILMILPSR